MIFLKDIYVEHKVKEQTFVSWVYSVEAYIYLVSCVITNNEMVALTHGRMVYIFAPRTRCGS